MGGLQHFWDQGDAITHGVSALLMLMSICAWVIIVWKGWMLRRVNRDLGPAVAAFWTAPNFDEGRQRLCAVDRERALSPLLAATLAAPGGDTLGARGRVESQLTRRLRDALHDVLAQLRSGQVVLASVGSTAPFVGLLGTVWGIYHALMGITAAGTLSIEQVAEPVGSALVMTAAGLAVAIPAVLAYNIFGQMVGASEAQLEGFAHDLRELSSGATSSDASAWPSDA